MHKSDNQKLVHPAVLYKLSRGDYGYELGLQFFVETIDADRFYFMDRPNADAWCAFHGIYYIGEDQMKEMRKKMT